MVEFIETMRRRDARDIQVAGGAPFELPLLDLEHAALLKRWCKSGSQRRTRKALLGDAGDSSIECAEGLCELLLCEGWIIRHEQLTRGTWQWVAITWRNLERVQSLMGVSTPQKRQEQRQGILVEMESWLESWGKFALESVIDPDLLEEMRAALTSLSDTTRIETLASRTTLMRKVAEWRGGDKEGTRRDFALMARDGTKAISDSDWRWLEQSFDLERLRINRFAPVLWLGGDFTVVRAKKALDLGAMRFLGLTMEDLAGVDSASPLERWWLIENRASFERQASSRSGGTLVVWVPGRPSVAWLATVTHLLRLAPAPAWISADIDPSGVDIACTVGQVWDRQGLSWAAYRMGPRELAQVQQFWPLNAHDERLLSVLKARPNLPSELKELCDAMLQSRRKAEQEGWI